LKRFIFNIFIFWSSLSLADSSSCRLILQDPLARDKESLEEFIFSDGDQFVFQNMKNKTDHGQIFAQNKEKILALLEKQGTFIAPVGEESFQENIYFIQGGESRLGRIAQKVWSLYGVRLLIDFDRLQDAAGSYHSYEKSIMVGLEDILYPNQLSRVLWHEAIHAKNDFESLVHLVIEDGTGESNPYPSFHLDELIAYEKNLIHIQNSKLLGQRVIGERKNIHPRLYSIQEILKDLSQRTLAKKEHILSFLSHLKSLEKNPKLAFQKTYKTLDFKELSPQVKVFTSGFLKDPLVSVPSRYFDLYPNLKENYFNGTPEEYRKDFMRRTRYSISLILKVLEIAEKHAGETL
jgi:hypothetical protein